MHHVKKSFFITFEGGEGVGKTTQIQLLASWLKKKGYSTLLTHEPGGTPMANRIRQILLHSDHVNPYTELFLYETARRDHVTKVIHPALKKGHVVLCDRFTDATLAYQGYARGLPLKLIQAFNQVATDGLQPNLTFVFDLPVSEGLERVRKRQKGLDRLEKEHLKFHEKVRNAYLTLAQKEKRRFCIINARKNRSEIFTSISYEVEKRLRKK